MAQNSKFQFKKILQFLIRQETSLKALAAFFKSMEDYEKKSLDAVLQFSRSNQEASSKLTNKQIAKQVNNYSIHVTQRSQSQVNTGLITEKLNVWLEGGLQKLKALQQKAKRMESTKQILSPKDVDSFKAELTDQIMQVNRLKESILNLYCHTMIKNSSLQLQELTSKMQTELDRKNVVPSVIKRK